jgi:release factor glutamine methyltransferase
LILANPPYVPSGRKLPRSLEQEPRRALFAGKDGLRYIRQLLKQAPAHLKAGGKLIIEFDSPQKTTIGALAKKSGYTAEFHKDQYKKWRYVILDSRLRGNDKRD